MAAHGRHWGAPVMSNTLRRASWDGHPVSLGTGFELHKQRISVMTKGGRFTSSNRLDVRIGARATADSPDGYPTEHASVVSIISR